MFKGEFMSIYAYDSMFLSGSDGISILVMSLWLGAFGSVIIDSSVDSTMPI